MPYFSLSLFPTDSIGEPDMPGSAVTTAGAPADVARAQTDVRPLDAAAAQVPVGWSDEDSTAESAWERWDSSAESGAATIEQESAVVMPLGSAGGH